MRQLWYLTLGLGILFLAAGCDDSKTTTRTEHESHQTLLIMLWTNNQSEPRRRSSLVLELYTPYNTMYTWDTTSAHAYVTTSGGAQVLTSKWYQAKGPLNGARIFQSWSRSTQLQFTKPGDYVIAHEISWRTADNDQRILIQYLQFTVLEEEDG